MSGEPEFLLHVEEHQFPALVPLGMSPAGGDREEIEQRLRIEAEALGLRAAAVGVDLAGGAGQILGDPERDKCPGLFRRIARDIEAHEGRIYLTQGFGLTSEDMGAIGLETRYVLGLPRELGGSGDPTPFTAAGVHAGIRACVGSLRGVRVGVIGVGRVGSHLASMLAAEEAIVTVADLDRDLAERVAAEYGAGAGSVEDVLYSNCDVLSPNGRGPVLTRETIPKLNCNYVAGAGSGQVGGLEEERLLAAGGIGYVPERIAGSGWLLNLAAELLPGGYTESAAFELVGTIERTAAVVLGSAAARDVG